MHCIALLVIVIVQKRVEKTQPNIVDRYGKE